MTQGAIRFGERHHANRQAAQLWPNRLLNGCKETIEVEIQTFDLLWPSHCDVIGSESIRT